MSNIWQDAVTDRSQADVNRVLYLLSKVKFAALTEDEQAEWLTDSKGALNTSDLARIKNNIELLMEVLELTNTVSDVPAYPQAGYYAELLTNVKAIRDGSVVYKSTPAVPEAPLNTFQKWNDIEHILLDVYNILLNNFHYYCGESLYAGDNTALLL